MIFEELLPHIANRYGNLYASHKYIISQPINVSTNILTTLLAFYIHHLIYNNYFTYPKTTIEYLFNGMILISMFSSFVIDLCRIYLISTAILQGTKTDLTKNPLVQHILKFSKHVTCTNLVLLLLTSIFTSDIHGVRLLVLANIYYYIRCKLDIPAVLILTLLLFRVILIMNFISMLFLTFLILYSTTIHNTYPQFTAYIAHLLDNRIREVYIQLLNINIRNDQPMPTLDEIMQNINQMDINAENQPANLNNLIERCAPVDVPHTEICAICRHTNAELSNNTASTETKTELNTETKTELNTETKTELNTETKTELNTETETKKEDANMEFMLHNDITSEISDIEFSDDEIQEAIFDEDARFDQFDQDDLFNSEDNREKRESMPTTIQWVQFGNCTHKFHRACIYGWFMTGNKSCPVCRAEIE